MPSPGSASGDSDLLEHGLDQQQIGARAGCDLGPILAGESHAVVSTEDGAGDLGLAFEHEGLDAVRG